MANRAELVEVVRCALSEFCRDFISNAYLCYTEHGLHALFFSTLYNALPEKHRFAQWNGLKLCVLQKEYPTAHDLGRSRRQHWDIAVIKTPVNARPMRNAFDCLPLAAVVEFGLNCALDHIEDDVSRLCHKDANVENRFAVHLYRLSGSAARVSRRDWAPNSRHICSRESIQRVLDGCPVEVLYGMADSSGTNENGLWLISSNSMNKLA